jgi:hypothetical protein
MTTQNQKDAKEAGRNGTQQMPAGAGQVHQIEAVVVPVEIWDQLKNAIRKLPVEDVEVLYLTMKQLRPQTVNMTQG